MIVQAMTEKLHGARVSCRSSVRSRMCSACLTLSGNRNCKNVLGVRSSWTSGGTMLTHFRLRTEVFDLADVVGVRLGSGIAQQDAARRPRDIAIYVADASCCIFLAAIDHADSLTLEDIIVD